MSIVVSLYFVSPNHASNHPVLLDPLNSIGSFATRFQGGTVDALLMKNDRLPDHDVHPQLLPSSSLQIDVLSKLEAQLAVDDDVDIVRAL